MSEIILGKSMVWGCGHTMRHIEGLPNGAKVKIRMRNNDIARVYIKQGATIRAYAIEVIGTLKDGRWVLLGPIGMNAHLCSEL